MASARKENETTHYSASRVYFPAGVYEHPPAGLVQLRVVRRGSSYASIDLGYGLRRVFTRPGDLLLSLPDRPTSFKIDDGRELTMVQLTPAFTMRLLRQFGGSLKDLEPLCHHPFREALIAEIARRLEETEFAERTLSEPALNLLVGLLIGSARRHVKNLPRPVLSPRLLRVLNTYIDENLHERISVEQLAGLANITPRRFSTAFLEATSMPAYQYVVQRRIERPHSLGKHRSKPSGHRCSVWLLAPGTHDSCISAPDGAHTCRI